MTHKLRMLLRAWGLRLLCAFGTPMIDRRTGERLGKVFAISWRGRIIVIGLENEPPVRAQFLPQERLTYWKQEIGFSSHPHPDFPRTSANDSEPASDAPDAR